MIIGFHLTWTTYGHWFPNDPRGSWSDELWRPELEAIRRLEVERKVACPRDVPPEELQAFLDMARERLVWPTVTLTREEIRAVGRALGELVVATKLSVGACAIMANHVHVVCERSNVSYERLVNRMKGRASQSVRKKRGIPVANDKKSRVPIWTQRYWVRFIDDVAQMECAIRYAEENPVRDGMGRQEWGFVRRLM